jgi:epoxyqueuosine reductase
VKAPPTSEPAYAPRTGLYAPDLIPLLALTEQEFRRRFRSSPILRAKRRGFLRNIAVALGNIGNAEAVPALVHALDDAEPLVRGHAAWALGRIGTAEALAGLRRRLGSEENAQVRAEIEEAISEGEKSCCVVSAKIIGA